MSPFAEYLQSFRRTNKLSQRELGHFVGYEQGYISAMEIDKKEPTADFLDAFCNKYNLTLLESDKLRFLASVSKRRLIIPKDAPTEAYSIIHRLMENIVDIHPSILRIFNEVITLVEERNAYLKTQGSKKLITDNIRE